VYRLVFLELYGRFLSRKDNFVGTIVAMYVDIDAVVNIDSIVFGPKERTKCKDWEIVFGPTARTSSTNGTRPFSKIVVIRRRQGLFDGFLPVTKVPLSKR
jgi:hypothetical protein